MRLLFAYAFIYILHLGFYYCCLFVVGFVLLCVVLFCFVLLAQVAGHSKQGANGCTGDSGSRKKRSEHFYILPKLFA